MKQLPGVRLGARRKMIPALAAVGTVLVSAGTLVSVTPAAQAESGRRICTYTSPQLVGNPDDPSNPDTGQKTSRKVALVLDYKKDGKCPNIDYRRVYLPADMSEWTPNANVYYPQPAPKDRCEDWDKMMQLPTAGNTSSDSCTIMTDDHLYAVVQGPFDPSNYIAKAYYDLGHYSQFE